MDLKAQRETKRDKERDRRIETKKGKEGQREAKSNKERRVETKRYKGSHMHVYICAKRDNE